MTQHPGTSHPCTVAEAAAILGVSTTTIRRMVKRGQLGGERVLRPQGSVYVVTLPADFPPVESDAAPTQQHAAGVARGNAAGTERAATLPNAKVEQLTAWSEAFLAPLIATIERQQEQLVSQAETIGRQSAELEALKTSTPDVEVSGGSKGHFVPLIPALTPWLFSALAIAAVVVLLVGLG